MVTLWWRPK